MTEKSIDHNQTSGEAGYPPLEDFEPTRWSLSNPRPAPIKGVDLRKMVETAPPKFDMVLPGLRRGISGILASPGGVGKSFLLLQSAVQIASGVDFMGFHTTPGRVVYVSIEDDEESLHARVYAIAKQFLSEKADLERLYKNLTLHCPQPGEIDLLTRPDWLDSACYGSRLVIIDTMRLSHSGDEVDAVQMTKLVAGLILHSRRHKSSTLLAAHSTKASALNGQAELAQSLRGSSVLTDNMRFQAFMVAMSEEEGAKWRESGKLVADQYEKYVKFGVSKTNYGPKGKPRWFERGEHGVLLPVPLESTATPAGKKPKKGNEHAYA